jgi:glycosyltransferase involved in cell wall biosynthesis
MEAVTGNVLTTALSKKGKNPVSGECLPEILIITSYPPRVCGIATYSHDLRSALKNKFSHSFSPVIGAVQSGDHALEYADEVKYILDTTSDASYRALTENINGNSAIQLVLIQHEFGLYQSLEPSFIQFLRALTKPIVVTFHTVLPHPDNGLKQRVRDIAEPCEAVIVMTNNSATLLRDDYGLPQQKITVIAHGTHLVPHAEKDQLKKKYDLTGKRVLTTFGLLSSGKSIETTLEALPAVVATNPDVLFLVVGKTHPSVVKEQGEKYRKMLQAMVEQLHLTAHVKFINQFLPLSELLEYLQLTDIYLFTSKDRNQAVSGTFAYALSCGCPIVSTPIPHAREVLKNDAGIIIDFENPEQLGRVVTTLLNDEELRKNISSNGLHRMAHTAWENTAIAYALLFARISGGELSLAYTIPPTNLKHLERMTTAEGMIQFSILNHPDPTSGYTLDDNARALVAFCQHFRLTHDEGDFHYIETYFNFIRKCFQPQGFFQNYVDEFGCFTPQNETTNLADSNGRAIWALGYLVSMSDLVPVDLISNAEAVLEQALGNVEKIHSTRAMAFAIKGLYYYQLKNNSSRVEFLITVLANRLVQMYKHEATKDWKWFESYLTYANGILPEAMLCAWLATQQPVYKEIAKLSFDFLLSKTFDDKGINVITNKNWGSAQANRNHVGGEQPIDVAYTIIALSKFADVFTDDGYDEKMKLAFNWFMGNNHLHEIIYNPCTGGCYDGLEENYVNLNQGAESTISYLMAKLTVDQFQKKETEELKKGSRLIHGKRKRINFQLPVTPVSGRDVNIER